MKIGVPCETALGERRVALVPDNVKRLLGKGHTVIVEAGAGEQAGSADAAYRAAGAEMADDFASLLDRAEVVVKVRVPSPSEAAALREGQAIVGLLQPMVNLERIEALRAGGITSFSLDALPRITRAQSMDVLSSQATVAGYRAVILGAQYLPKLFPLLMTAAGTLAPARVLILGAGVAGLQAVATAKRLGAQVQAFDTRPAVKEQVESLGATFLTLPLTVEAAETAGGYARQLDRDLEARERELLAEPVALADVVVSTAMVPGARAPQLISAEMVATMKAGSVILDLAAEGGGNCALTQPGERVVASNGVVIEGATDLPSQVAIHASQLYGHNMQEFLGLLLQAGVRELEDHRREWTLTEDEILQATCITHAYRIQHGPTLERITARGGDAVVVEQSHP